MNPTDPVQQPRHGIRVTLWLVLVALVCLTGFALYHHSTARSIAATCTGADPEPLLSIPGGASGAAFSPDGSRLALAHGWGSKELDIYDALTGKELVVFRGHDSWIQAVAFSPDGKRVVSASADKTAKVWDVTDGKVLLTIEGHTGWVQAVAFSRDGKQLATAGDTADGRCVRIWDAGSGRAVASLPGRGECFAFSPDGTTIAIVVDAGVALWDLATARERKTLTGSVAKVRELCFSPNGGRLAAACGDAAQMGQPGGYVLWNVESGKTLLAGKGLDRGEQAIAFSPDGRVFAVSSFDGGVRFFEAAHGRELRRLKRSSAVTHVRFSPDGSRVVLSDTTPAVTVWDVKKLYESRAED